MKAQNKKRLYNTRTTHRRSRKKRIIKNILLVVTAGLLIPLLFLYLYVAYYYDNRFYKATTINGVDTSNMTLEEAEDLITARVKAYKLTLYGRNNVTDTIGGDSINLHTVFEKGLSELIAEQKSFSWPVRLFQPHEYEIKTMLEYDEGLLEQAFQNLSFFNEENSVEPENASISEYGPNGYEAIPEQQGAKVIEDVLYDAVENAILTLEPTLFLEDIDCYEKPEITTEYQPLIDALAEMNKLAGTRITYEFGDKTEVLDGSRISQWISVDDQFQVTYDPGDGIKEFVDYIGKNYNTFGKKRTFKTSYGDVITVEGGDYGWWLNRPAETEELEQLVKEGAQVTRQPIYYQTAHQYGEDDIGNTYVEINLIAQHLFFYKEGELIVETDIVSGNVSKGNATPVGTYPIQYKENNAVLVGEDYETPVKYWMPFNRNIGLHDADWRKEFGKDIYLTKGSHGCINMPPEAAELVFKNIKRGVAVVVYELPGTENYDTKEEKAASGKTATQ